MSKYDKLIQRVFQGKSDLTPDEAGNILKGLGFHASINSGSHRTFRKANRPSITIVLTQDPVKPYLLDKLKEALINEGYKND